MFGISILKTNIEKQT